MNTRCILPIRSVAGNSTKHLAELTPFNDSMHTPPKICEMYVNILILIVVLAMTKSRSTINAIFREIVDVRWPMYCHATDDTFKQNVIWQVIHLRRMSYDRWYMSAECHTTEYRPSQNVIRQMMHLRTMPYDRWYIYAECHTTDDTSTQTVIQLQMMHLRRMSYDRW